MVTNLSRRNVLAGIGGGALLLSVAACQSAVSSESNGKAVKGGTLHGGINIDLVPANFYTNSNYGVTTIIGLVYESLVHYPNDSLEAQPKLAKSWQISDDGLTVTLQLRDDVTFHTGRPFTSKDVEFSLKTYADPKWNGQLKSTAAAISSIDTSDAHTAVLHLAHPLGNIIDLLDIVPIVDSETFSGIGDGSRYVGTGPFTFVKWTPNTRLLFSKNKKYWVPGKPYLDAVDIAVVTDATSLTNQLRSGQLDYGYGSTNLDIDHLVDSGKFKKIQLTGAEQQIYVGVNVAAEALSDVKVRQAIAYAIDRERIMSEVFRGSGYTINLPWPKYSTAYDAELNKTYSYDPAKAKQLVQAYGKKIPPVKLNYAANPPAYAATAQIIQANLKAVGIEVELDPLDPATAVAELIGGKYPGLWTNFHSWAQYTPSTLTVSAYPFNALSNTSHYSDPGYTKDAQGAWQQVKGDSPEALAEYAKLSQDLLDSLFLIEIGVVQARWVYSRKVSGIDYTKRSELVLTDTKLTA